jgi:hypothetical protein
MVRWLTILTLVLASVQAHGTVTQAERFAEDGGAIVTLWTEAAGVASAPIFFNDVTICVNTGTTNFNVYTASSLAKQGIWMGPIIPQGSCAPGAGTATCGAAKLPAGWWSLMPAGSNGASATCTTRRK